MKFDKTELNVAPGQRVEITYVNPDVMQHNFVLGAPGSLTAIGEAGDRSQTSLYGAGASIRARICRRCSTTKPLEPGQTVTFQFRAPPHAGDTPRVHVPCALAGFYEWRLNVVAPAGRGGPGRAGRP